jgi:hypothetical protein
MAYPVKLVIWSDPLHKAAVVIGAVWLLTLGPGCAAPRSGTIEAERNAQECQGRAFLGHAAAAPIFRNAPTSTPIQLAAYHEPAHGPASPWRRTGRCTASDASPREPAAQVAAGSRGVAGTHFGSRHRRIVVSLLHESA